MKPELISAFREHIEARLNCSNSINDHFGVIHWREEMQKLDRIETESMVISIVGLTANVDGLTLESSLKDSGVDSLGMVESIMAIEQQFNVELDDRELDTIETVGDLVELTIKTKEGK